MSTAEAAADEGGTEEAFEYVPQAGQHVGSIVVGTAERIVTGADLDASVETNGTSFGVVLSNPAVAVGSAWRNRDVPEAFGTITELNDTIKIAVGDADYVRDTEVTEEATEAARERLVEAGVLDTAEQADEIETSETPQEGLTATLDGDTISGSGSDFKIANTDDRSTSVKKVDSTTLGVDVGGGTFDSERVESLDVDKLMVWYDNMSGERVGEVLDFNGRPSVRYKDDGYLVKGLLQKPIGWRGDADLEAHDDVPTTDRGKLKNEFGRQPRVARRPILRDGARGEEIFIHRFRPSADSRMVFANVGLNEGDWTAEEYIEARDTALDSDASIEEQVDGLSMLYPRYEPDPEPVLEREFGGGDVYSLYHGPGWQQQPENSMDELQTDRSEPNEGASFDVPDVGGDGGRGDGPTEAEQQFATDVAEQLAGTSVTDTQVIDEQQAVFGDGETTLRDVIDQHAEQFDGEPRHEVIEETLRDEMAK